MAGPDSMLPSVVQENGCWQCKACEGNEASERRPSPRAPESGADAWSEAVELAEDTDAMDLQAAGFVNRRGNKPAPHPELEIFTFQSLRKR